MRGEWKGCEGKNIKEGLGGAVNLRGFTIGRHKKTRDFRKGGNNTAKKGKIKARCVLITNWDSGSQRGEIDAKKAPTDKNLGKTPG